MAECRNCGAPLESSYRFCPMCATPLTDEARKRLQAFVRQRAEHAAGGGGTTSGTAGLDADLEERVRYAVGFVAVVAGLATLLEVGGIFLLLGGLAVLPPVQRAVEGQLDQRVGAKPTFGVAGVLTALGVVVLVVA